MKKNKYKLTKQSKIAVREIFGIFIRGKYKKQMISFDR